MTLPYGVISDCHYHKWDAFSTTNAEGLNSRLEIQLEATKEAAIAMKKAGCKYMLVAGDTFHVRGTVSPSVLHYVTETYKWIINELDLTVVMLAGNHDLETNDSVYSAWICPYISRHLLSLNPLQARCRRYSRGER